MYLMLSSRVGTEHRLFGFQDGTIDVNPCHKALHSHSVRILSISSQVQRDPAIDIHVLIIIIIAYNLILPIIVPDIYACSCFMSFSFFGMSTMFPFSNNITFSFYLSRVCSMVSQVMIKRCF